jgi:hypothetical protein
LASGPKVRRESLPRTRCWNDGRAADMELSLRLLGERQLRARRWGAGAGAGAGVELEWVRCVRLTAGRRAIGICPVQVTVT